MSQSTDTIRLQKYLSAVGHCSRRQGEQLIRGGRVQLNGQTVTEMGTQLRPGVDRVAVDGKNVPWEIELVYLAVHKPVGMITTLNDPEGRPVITDLLPPLLPRLWPVGRLDWDSEGLVLMTNDGALTHALTHPGCEVEKVYDVKLRGMINASDPSLQSLREGVTLDDGFQTSSAEVTVEGHTGRHSWVQIILHEGRNRQIRRMAEAVGHTVLKLRRVSIGPLALEPLPPRTWRYLTRSEAHALYQAAGLKIPHRLSRRAKGPLIPQNMRKASQTKAKETAKKTAKKKSNRRGGR